MQSTRMFQMVYLLLIHGRMPAAELAARMEVSVRTVYRDAQALCEAGVPLCAERGPGGGLSLMPTFTLDRAALSETERRDLLGALEAMTRTGAQDGQALQKLCALFQASAPDWVRIDFSDWSDTKQALLDTLREAILHRRLLALTYCGESGACTQRTVCPMRLWFKGKNWYLLAYCLKRRAARTFKLTRIRDAQPVPGLFPPEAYACSLPDAQPHSVPDQPIELMVDASAAYRVYDDFSDAEVTRLPDGRFHIHAAYPPGAWVVSMILSYGAHAQALSPPALVQAVENALRDALSRYTSDARTADDARESHALESPPHSNSTHI